MAKKKTQPQAEPDITEAVAEIEQPIETLEADGLWHAVYTPLWRAELDCGDHASLQAAKEAVYDTIVEWVGHEFYADENELVVRDSSLDWREGEDGAVYAYGHDASPDETHLPLARIVRVAP